jgi:hypothetical protein
VLSLRLDSPSGNFQDLLSKREFQANITLIFLNPVIELLAPTLLYSPEASSLTIASFRSIQYTVLSVLDSPHPSVHITPECLPTYSGSRLGIFAGPCGFS